MIKHLFIILLLVFNTNAFAGYGGYIGKYDNRRYGSLEEPEYNGIVKLMLDHGVRCTGGFISKNIILTNNHCAMLCKKGCRAEFWNGSGYEQSNLKIALFYTKSSTYNGDDWALLVSDKESNFYKTIAPMSTTGQVLRGGYGSLRVIEDSEIPELKRLYAQATQDFKEECNKKGKNLIECINEKFNKRLKESGKKPLFGDMDNFKVQTCNILGSYPGKNKMLRTDCDSSGGDSGAPFLRAGQIVGLNNGGLQGVFGDEKANAIGIKTENFYIFTQGIIQKYKNANPDNNFLVPWGGTVNTNKQNETLGPVSLDFGEPVADDETIEQTLEQKLQDFDCD